MKNFTKIAVLSVFFVFPLISFAQFEDYGVDGADPGPSTSSRTINCSGLTDFSGIVRCAASMMNAAIYLLMSFSLVYTVYGAFNFIRVEGNDREKWREVIIHGIIGLFVISSIWGLVRILDGTFNLNKTQIAPPTFNVK